VNEREEPVPPRAIVLISIDSLRADHLGSYGYKRDTSPAIDRLAADGVLFEDAMSTTSWTLPSHLSMLTSLYPEVHGVVKNGQRLSERAVLISELLGPLGYRTAAFVSAPYLRGKFGFNQGFDHYDEDTISILEPRLSHRGVTTPTLHSQVVPWLQANANRPFFLFIHYWDVHYDYDPPAPFDTKFDPDYEGTIDANGFAGNKEINSRMDARDLAHVIALYDGEIGFTDSYIGKLLDELRSLEVYEDSLIVLTADHGEEFFEHGGKSHSHNLYQESVAVPLIIKFPQGRWSGTRVDKPASIVDIAPTILDYIEQPVHPDFNGKSLLPVIRGEIEIRTLFADLRTDTKVARQGRYKLITTVDHKGRPRNSLFDLEKDPSEQANLVATDPARAEELLELLSAWREEAKQRAIDLGAADFEYDRELTERLKSLGYLDQ